MYIYVYPCKSVYKISENTAPSHVYKWLQMITNAHEEKQRSVEL